ncbi:GM11991 [Drosophila sechellia]|uniref:GM11991 n=1 Tax=Drosophila sechellia TaxID=7238 RepID=B4IL66_DROSE|nr:GM11991 [Drosophila sechellia]
MATPGAGAGPGHELAPTPTQILAETQIWGWSGVGAPGHASKSGTITTIINMATSATKSQSCTFATLCTLT